MPTIPYFMRMDTFTADDCQAVRNLSTVWLEGIIAAAPKAPKVNPSALAEAESELAYRRRTVAEQPNA